MSHQPEIRIAVTAPGNLIAHSALNYKQADHRLRLVAAKLRTLNLSMCYCFSRGGCGQSPHLGQSVHLGFSPYTSVMTGPDPWTSAGIPYGLQSSLLPVYLRGAGHSLTRIGFTKILYFPWVLKVLWAPLVDRLSTKRYWLVATVSGLALTCLASAALAPEAHIWGVAGTLLAMNTLASVQDIAVDGAAVGLLKGRGELGLGNTAQVVGYKAGSVFAGGGLLAVIDVAGWSWMFMLLTFVYAGVALFVWGTPVLDDDTLKGQQADGSRRGAQGLDAMMPWRVWRKMLAVPGTPWTVLYVLTYKLGEQGAVTMFPLFPVGSPHDRQGARLLERCHRHGLLHRRVVPGRPAAVSVQ
ncbi:unnamed protein product, partial [Pleuronectes platessa]